MNKHVQIRNLPEALHKRLKIKAAAQGRSLSDYLREEMERLARLPTRDEWFAMVKQWTPVNLPADDIVNAIHEGREENDKIFDRLFDKPQQ